MDFAGDLVSDITVKLTDDHDRVHSTTFTVAMLLQQYAASGGESNWNEDAADWNEAGVDAKGQINKNGLNCVTMCGGEENNLDWESVDEQIEFCFAIAQIVIQRVPRGQ